MDHLNDTVRLPVTTVVDERLRTTSICLGVAYGSRNDPPGRGGLAHLLEHLLLSAPVADVGPLVQHIDRLGGSANAETGLERMLYYAQVLAEDADEVIGLLLRSVLEPDVDPGTLASERAAVLQELAAARADPADVVQDAFLATLFAGHPLGRPVAGTDAEVSAIDMAALTAAHRSTFRRSPMVLAVVGPRPPRLPAGVEVIARPTAPFTEPTPLAPLRATEPSWPDSFGWLSLGGRSAARGADTGPYAVLAQLLGGGAGSVLYRRLRVEEGMAYAFQSWDRAYTEAGAWRVLVGVEAGSGPKVADLVRGELERLAERGPTEQDLEAARRQERMRLFLDLESPAEHARLLATGLLQHPTGWQPGDELDRVLAVTAEEVREAAARICSDLVTVVRPTGDA